jgi:hypothetical protein
LTVTRRHLLTTVAAMAVPVRWGPALATPADLITRVIPSTGERLPAIGMGSYRTFDVSLDAESRARLSQVLALLFEAGGALPDADTRQRMEALIDAL